MKNFYRHDIAETNKLVTMGFGIDGIDRYIVVYKKEYFPPSEDEIAARKNGDEWNEETSKEYAQRVGFAIFIKVTLYRVNLCMS